MTLVAYTLAYGVILVLIVLAFLWFIGRGRDFKMKNDEIFERELRKKIELTKNK